MSVLKNALISGSQATIDFFLSLPEETLRLVTKNDGADTLLHIAARNQYSSLTRMIESGDLYKRLLQKYISPDAKNNNGDTLLHLLMRRFTACPIPIKEAIKIVLKSG